VLARLAPRSAPPMPPDPVGRRERSRARPPPAVGAGVLARAPSGARPLRGLRVQRQRGSAARPGRRRPAWRLSAPASTLVLARPLRRPAPKLPRGSAAGPRSRRPSSAPLGVGHPPGLQRSRSRKERRGSRAVAAHGRAPDGACAM